MVFPRWTWSWSPLAAFLRWPSALIARVAAAVLWLWSTQAKKGSVAPDIEGGLEGLDVKEDPAPAPGENSSPVTKVENVIVRHAKGDFIASGVSGILERLPSGYVSKSPWPGIGAAQSCQDITIESKIYEKLGRHPRLVQIIDWDQKDCVLTMEYMPNGTLGKYLLANTDTISTTQRLQWVQEAAEGLQLLHVANVIHCDVEPKNFLLDVNLGLKIADFSGSTLDGSQATACASQKFLPPDYDWERQPTVKDDLFALGSTIYCIMTGQQPFQELSNDEAEDNYRVGNFPDVANIVCRDIILRCWNTEVASAQEVYDFIKDIR